MGCERLCTQLSLRNLGVEGHREITNSNALDSEVSNSFGRKTGSGWKTQLEEHLIAEECRNIWELYTKVYNHPLSNRVYTNFFLKA
jgi:hypothetical protein